MGRFDGRTAVVTGAGSGIGRRSAEHFAAEGARVVCVDLSSEDASAVAEKIGGIPVVGDVGEPGLWRSVVEAVTRATAESGRLAAAHLNAGIFGWTGAIEDLPDDLYRRMQSANVDGVVLGVRALVPLLRVAGGGALVATASVAGLVPFTPNPVYTLTKHAVVGFVRALAPILAEDGIGLSAVCPAVVDTPMTAEALAGRALGENAPSIPLIPVEAVAETVVELAYQRAQGICRAVLAHGRLDWEFGGWERLTPPAA